MSVRFSLEDKDNKPYQDPVRVVCWGFLKTLKHTWDSHVTINSSKSKIKDYGIQKFYGACTLDNNPPKFLRVYSTYTKDHRVGKRLDFESIKDTYERVLKHIPSWFGDFCLKYDRSLKEYYLRVSLDASALVNYNALRVIRNLDMQATCEGLSWTTTAPLAKDPMDILIQTEFANIYKTSRTNSTDSLCVPIDVLGSYEDIFKVIERGPQSTDYDFTLGTIDSEEASHFFMNHAFCTDQDKLDTLVSGRRLEIEGKEIPTYKDMTKTLNRRRREL